MCTVDSLLQFNKQKKLFDFKNLGSIECKYLKLNNTELIIISRLKIMQWIAAIIIKGIVDVSDKKPFVHCKSYFDKHDSSFPTHMKNNHTIDNYWSKIN